MHENANITYQGQESGKIIDAILFIQPRLALAGKGGKTVDEVVMQMAEEFEEQLPQTLSILTGNQEHFVINDQGNMHSLSIVLMQEI